MKPRYSFVVITALCAQILIAFWVNLILGTLLLVLSLLTLFYSIKNTKETKNNAVSVNNPTTTSVILGILLICTTALGTLSCFLFLILRTI